MEFSFTEEQEFFRQTVRDTIDRMIMPKVQELDESEEFSFELWHEFAKLGYLGIRHPEMYGGMDLDVISQMIFYEELYRGDVGFAMTVAMQILMGTYFIGRFGTEEIKQKVLVPAMRGEKIGTICFTEDQSGSDLAGTRTTAVLDGDEWVINGTKMWITNAPTCNFCTVLATTDPSQGIKALNFFLVEEDMPGFSRGQRLKKVGSRSSTTGELIFDNVRVPKDYFLGEELGKGVQYAGEILNEVRVMTGLAGCAIAKMAMDDAKGYANRRVAFGNPISKYQLIRSKFANFWAWYEAARWYLYRCAWMIQEGLPCLNECMLAKMFATEMCMSAVDEATRIYGGNAFAMEYPPQRYFRDARFLLYGGGCHEVLQDYLGRMYLKED